MEVRTNKGTLCNESGGLEGPKTVVKVNPTSREMYVVATKKARVKNEKGCESGYGYVKQVAFATRRRLTMRELRVPSSTTCVLTIPFAKSVQKVAATRPACIAVSTTRAVEPCSRKEPVVRS